MCTCRSLINLGLAIVRGQKNYNLITASCQTFVDKYLLRCGCNNKYMTTVKKTTIKGSKLIFFIIFGVCILCVATELGKNGFANLLPIINHYNIIIYH